MRGAAFFCLAVWVTLIVIALAGCVHGAPAAVAVCPPVKTYPAEAQKRMAEAVAALPADSPLVGAIVDYGALRAAARACATAGGAP